MRINTAEKGKQTPQWAAIGTFNIRGLSGNVEAVEKIINTYRLQILAITETWMRPMDAVPLPYRTESICLAPPGQRYRGQGGITLVLQPNTLYRLIEKRADRNHQMVAIRVKGVTIIALYLAPSLIRPRILEILKNIQRISRGPSIILGDLNGRHPSWDMSLQTGQANPQGNAIHTWARQFGWEVKGTIAPTYESMHGKSTIDLFLVKNLPLQRPRVAYGP